MVIKHLSNSFERSNALLRRNQSLLFIVTHSDLQRVSHLNPVHLHSSKTIWPLNEACGMSTINLVGADMSNMYNSSVLCTKISHSSIRFPSSAKLLKLSFIGKQCWSCRFDPSGINFALILTFKPATTSLQNLQEDK